MTSVDLHEDRDDPPPEPAPVPIAAATGWPPIPRALFRFACLYLLLYNLPFPLAHLPFQGPDEPLAALAEAASGYSEYTDGVATQFGTAVLGMAKVERLPTGSGDTPIDYAHAALLASIALLGALIWWFFDRRGRAHDVLHAALRLYVRYALAAILLGYGFHKVFPLQFGSMQDERLFGTFGHASPMNMLWTFLAASAPYTIFSGAMEVLGGVLLFFRRTTTLGALVSIAVMTNIVMLNLCYDVPVKLYSAHLLAMAAFLALGDAPRLVAVLLTNRTAPPATLRAPLPLWAKLPMIVIGLAFAGWLTWKAFDGSRVYWLKTRDASDAPLHGIWQVDEFSSEPATTLATPKTWKRLTLGDRVWATVTLVDDTKIFAKADVDATKSTLTLTVQGANASPPATLAFERQTVTIEPKNPYDGYWPTMQPLLRTPLPTTEERLLLTGPYDGATVRITAKKLDPDLFLIRGRGFHWMQDYPLNFNR